MLYSIEHRLYRLEKAKIIFEQYWSIKSMLYWPIFNYPKFYIINHFIWCIWDYDSTINYDSAYSKIAYKYLFKSFYNRINKKVYKLQI